MADTTAEVMLMLGITYEDSDRCGHCRHVSGDLAEYLTGRLLCPRCVHELTGDDPAEVVTDDDRRR